MAAPAVKRSRLLELSLAGNQFGEAGAQIIGSLLEHSQIEVLDISNNHIQSGIQFICQGIRRNVYLRQLLVRENEIEDGSVVAETLVVNNQLEILDLSNNPLFLQGVNDIFLALTVNKTLSTLHLAQIDISDAIDTLCRLLVQFSLKRLDLSRCRYAYDKVERIVGGLEQNRTIVCLDLDIQVTNHR